MFVPQGLGLKLSLPGFQIRHSVVPIIPDASRRQPLTDLNRPGFIHPLPGLAQLPAELLHRLAQKQPYIRQPQCPLAGAGAQCARWGNATYTFCSAYEQTLLYSLHSRLGSCLLRCCASRARRPSHGRPPAWGRPAKAARRADWRAPARRWPAKVSAWRRAKARPGPVAHLWPLPLCCWPCASNQELKCSAANIR